MTTKYRVFEIASLIATAAGVFIFIKWLGWKYEFIITAVVFWIGYATIRMLTDKTIGKHWGISKENFKPAMKWIGIISVIPICGILIFGLLVSKPPFSLRILYMVPAYLVWGFIQQFLMMSLIAGYLRDLKLKPLWIILITSILFSIVHCSCIGLLIITFVMAIIFTILFLKYRNIIPLAIFHGVLGTLLYYFILDIDQWHGWFCIITI